MRDPLAEQVLEDFLDFADRQRRRDEVFDERRVLAAQVLEQVLRVLAAEEVRREPLHQLGQVGREHGLRIDHGVAEEFRALAVGRR